MKVSHNELKGLCRKVFEGMGFEEGDAGDAADMVAWMQGYRLGGLEALNRGLNYLLNEDAEVPPDVLYQDGDLAVLDGHGQSVLRSSSLAVELGFAKARARGLSVVKVRHCHNRQLIMGYLSRLAARGMNVTAFWRNAHAPLTEQVVCFRSNSTVPEIRVYAVQEVPEETEPNDAITLVLTNHTGLMPAMRSDYHYDMIAKHSESDLLECRKQTLAQGIDVDDQVWARLKELSARILVESSDASRGGAGAGTTDND